MLPRLLEESQVFLSCNIDACMSMSNDSIPVVRIASKQFSACASVETANVVQIHSFMLESVESCSPEFTGESYMF